MNMILVSNIRFSDTGSSVVLVRYVYHWRPSCIFKMAAFKM